MAYKFTAARRAALARAQKRSAQLRRKGAGKNGSRNFYGKGRKGKRKQPRKLPTAISGMAFRFRNNGGAKPGATSGSAVVKQRLVER